MSGWLAGLLLVVESATLTAGAPQVVDGWRDRLDLGGHVEALIDGIPEQDAMELRSRLTIDATLDVSEWVRIQADAIVSGLVSRRYGESSNDLVVRPSDTWIEFASERVDIRAGYGQIVWGRLDEIQPTDVVNPLDASQFLLDGRAAARLPVAFARVRYFATDDLTFEGVLIPWFRRGRFDEVDESRSPFNLLRGSAQSLGAVALPVEHDEPSSAWRNVAGGGRVSSTFGRVDVSAGVYRGFDAFGPVTFERPSTPVDGTTPARGRLVEHHRRFTMIGGDFETVVGDWGWRGEVAVFVEKTLAAVSRPGVVEGRLVEGGFGFDRQAGGFRVYGSLFGRREWSSEDPAVDYRELSVVGSVERSFARERYLVRAFGLVNPSDESGFLRGLLSWRARDNVVIDVSAAVFLGAGDDTLGRFNGRDFAFARVKYYF